MAVAEALNHAGDWLGDGLRSATAHVRAVAAERLVPATWEFWMPVLPMVFYWAVAVFFDVLDNLQLPQTEAHRIHPQKLADARNAVPKGTLIRRVALQHLIQLVTAYVFTIADPQFCDAHPWPGLAWAVVQWGGAMMVMDAWQYAIHRLMHESKFLYNFIHSTHHRMLVCYAYGALYNHPIEALLLDTVGALVTMTTVGLDCGTATFFFTFSSVKTVLDHSGYRFPVNLLHNVFPNNAAYHDVHHDLRGFRKNYSQPFFSHWDRLFGTYADPATFYTAPTDGKDKSS